MVVPVDDPLMCVCRGEFFHLWETIQNVEDFCADVDWPRQAGDHMESDILTGIYAWGADENDNKPPEAADIKSELEPWSNYSGNLCEHLFSDVGTAGSVNSEGYANLACELATNTSEMHTQYAHSRTRPAIHRASRAHEALIHIKIKPESQHQIWTTRKPRNLMCF